MSTLNKNSNIFQSTQSQAVYLIFLWVLSGALSSLLWHAKEVLYLDNRLLFSYFYNNWHSLSAYSEPAWWFPNNQLGAPGYSYSLLGVVNAATPLFVLYSGVFYLLGKFGIVLNAFQSLYNFYLCFLIPLPYFLGIWLLARQLFKRGVVVVFILTTAAFSPPIFQNLKDPGFLEILGYGFLFAGSFVYLARRPSSFSFSLFIASTLVMTVSLGFAFFTWNIFFLPLFIVTVFTINSKIRHRLIDFLAKRKIQVILFLLAITLCFLPKYAAYISMADLLRPNIGSQYHSIFALQPGTAWQLFLSSIPSLSFENIAVREPFFPSPKPFFPHPNYLGLLFLPLFFYGLVFTSPIWKRVSVIFIGVLFGIILVGSYSPFYCLLASLLRPLRSANHLFDITYGFGISALMLFFTGLGLESFLKRSKSRKKFIYFIVASLFFSFLIFYQQFERHFVFGFFTGWHFTLGLLMAILFVALSTLPSKRSFRSLLSLLLFIHIIDTASVHWMMVLKNLGTTPIEDFDIQTKDLIGIEGITPNFAANEAFLFRDHYKILKYEPSKLPYISNFNRVHTSPSLSALDFQFAKETNSKNRSLYLNPAEFPDENLSDITKTDLSKETFQFKQLAKTYNRIEFEVETSHPTLFFLRDAYSPFWSAKINGTPVKLYRALGNFKAVKIPAGHSVIKFSYFPKFTAYSLLLAELIVFVSFLNLLYQRFKFERY